jgi:hypothetical protein
MALIRRAFTAAAWKECGSASKLETFDRNVATLQGEGEGDDGAHAERKMAHLKGWRKTPKEWRTCREKKSIQSPENRPRQQKKIASCMAPDAANAAHVAAPRRAADTGGGGAESERRISRPALPPVTRLSRPFCVADSKESLG